MKINATWIRQWLLCLLNNEDYLAYCLRPREEEIIEENEGSRLNTSISNVFADFGDLYAELPTFSTNEVKAWIHSRRSLFFSSTKVVSIANPGLHEKKAGHILLDIELSEDIEITLKEVKRVLGIAYLPELSYRLHTGKQGMLPLKPLAKYALHGDCNMATLGRVRKAVSAGMYRHRDSPLRAKPLSITETVLAIKKDKRNAFGWTMSSDDLEAEKRGAFGSHILASSEVALLKRARKDFAALVRNVIHGRFPDFT